MNKKIIVITIIGIIIIASMVGVLIFIDWDDGDTIYAHFFKTRENQMFDYSSFAVDDNGNLYIGTCHKQRWQKEGGEWSDHYYLYSFYPNQTKRWEFKTTNSEIIKGGPVIHPNKDIVIVTAESYSSINNGPDNFNATYNKLYAINMGDGTLNWSSPKLVQDITDNNWGNNGLNPAIDGSGYIYVQSQHNITSFYDNGTIRWYNDSLAPLEFNYAGSPSIFNDTVYFHSGETDSYYILAFYTNGTYKWTYKIEKDNGNNRFNQISIDNSGNLYMGSENTSCGSDNTCFHAINPDGTQKWNFSVSTPCAKIRCNAAIDTDGTIYFGTKNNQNSEFYALNPDGTQKWKYNGPLQDVYSSPTIANDGTIFFGTEDRYVYRLDKTNGKLKNRYQLHSDVTSSSCTFDNDGTLYIGDMAGYLYAIEIGNIGLADTPWACIGSNFQRTRYIVSN